MIDLLGQQLGNYRLVRLLGQGGFADVYLGEHLHLNSQAAIKVLHMQLVGSALEQFRHEGRTIARLNHPNIVRVFDFDVENDTPFLVMDYAPNGTLRHRYPRGAVLSPVTILPHFLQIARALQYAHDRKLIHRDIKPENMLLGPNNEVLLSDFGLVLSAQSTGSQTRKELAGTLPYMAPEQIHGRPRSASDQYALGIVLYEWLSGDRPFRGTPMEIVTQHLVTTPAPLYGKVPGLSRAVEEVLFQALAKDPQQRFARIEAFASALEQACQYTQDEAMTLPTMVASQHPSTQLMFLTPTPGLSQQIPFVNASQHQARDNAPPADQLASTKPLVREASQHIHVAPAPSRPSPSVSIVTPSGTPSHSGGSPSSRSAEHPPSYLPVRQDQHTAAPNLNTNSPIRRRNTRLVFAGVIMMMLVLALVSGTVFFLPKIRAAGNGSTSTLDHPSGSTYSVTPPSATTPAITPTPTNAPSGSTSGSTYSVTPPSTTTPVITPTPTITTTPAITPTPTITATPTTGPVITSFVGTWQNSDPNTRDWVSIEITAQGNTLSAHFFGACTPTPCDAGSTSTSYTGNPVHLHLIESFATRDFTLTLTGSNLHVTTFTHFTDNSGRSDYTIQDDFHQ